MIDFTTITACGECCTGCEKKLDGRCPGCIEADGCVPEWAGSGRCRIHACVKEHEALFCGLCECFPCEKLPSLISWNPDIVKHLEGLRKEYESQKTIDKYIELYKENGYIREMRKYVGHAPVQTCACGVIIENADGEILLQKRRDNGCWAIIGGSMEMGESFEEAVKREAKEEAGLSLGRLELFKLVSGRERIIEYPNGDICFGAGIVFITREYEGEIVNDPEEVMEHRFFKKDELPGDLNAYDEDIIRDWAQGKRYENTL